MNKNLKYLWLLLLSGSMEAQNVQVSESSQKLRLADYIIEEFYVDNFDDKKVVDAAIVAMVKQLDPHSEYMDKEATRALNEPMQGNFEGIGVQFNMLNDTLFVVETVAGGPSEKAGILAGDRFIYVNDTLIAGVKIPNTDIMRCLRGPKGSEVHIKVKRANSPELIEYKIIRDKIPLYSMDAAYMIDKEIGYIKLSRFQSNSHDEVLQAIKKLNSEGMKDLIIDLEGNGGGVLGGAIDIANEFLGEKQLIVYTQGRKSPRFEAVSDSNGQFLTGRLVLLVDETSASASEIVSGAIQDWDRGVIVGRRTFGKGLVQRQLPLMDGTMLKLTVARYYTPSGRCVQKPFDNAEEYEKDLFNRLKRGELNHLDSIKLPDSLKYTTLVNKRTVFGGGGIMPDIFVPIDTTRSNSFHRNLIARGCFNSYTLSYTDKYRSKLKSTYPNIAAFKQNFIVTDDILKGLLEEGKKEKVEPKEGELEQAKYLISIQLKALIARDLWGMEEYFMVINDENKSLSKALEVLTTKGLYDSILKK